MVVHSYDITFCCVQCMCDLPTGMYVHPHVYLVPVEARRSPVSVPLELELRWLGATMCVLGTKSGSSVNWPVFLNTEP